MQLTFLQADRPLIKRYTKTETGYDKESYTDAYKFSSIIESADSITTMAEAITRHAGKGNCLHTGSLSKTLQQERRKGCHDPDEKRAWIVLDLDELRGFTSVEDVIAELPKEFHDVSYIEQHSAGSGMKPGLNMHLFFLLDREEHMKDIKNWMMHTNLVTKTLRDKVTLTAKNYGLSYPLDRIANDNGRIIYIAPPECVGFEDPIPDRVRVVTKGNDILRYPFTSSTVSEVRAEERKLIGELRKAIGLETSRAKTFYTVSKSGVDVLKKDLTEPGRIHPVQKDNDFVVRCNLDDGDSEAYFYYVTAPELLRNHKGEPALLMATVDPEYYKKVALPEEEAAREKTARPFVFRNLWDDRWYTGLRLEGEILEQPQPTGTEAKIKYYFAQHGNPGSPEPETWRMEFDPTLDGQWNPDRRIFNTWRMSKYMKNANAFTTLPPATITKIIGHALGGDGEAYAHFMNWIAYIFQTRSKTGTAWILHGVQGTGKGLLIDHVLRPLFGKDYVNKQQSRNLKSEMNGFLEKAIIVNIDEFNINDTGTDRGGVEQALKMWITDSHMSLRDLYIRSHMVQNYSNFILTTNAKSPMPVDEGDRRFSFGVAQTERLEITPDEIDAIPGELQAFANYLSMYKVDAQLAHVCLENEAKEHAKLLSKNTIEKFAEAVEEGDLQFFIDGASERTADPGRSGEYKLLLARWIADAKDTGESRIPAHELLEAYKTICNEDRMLKTNKFKQTMRHKDLHFQRLSHADGTRFDGYKVVWKVDQETLVTIGAHLSAVPSGPNLEKKLQDEINLASPKEQQ